MFTGLIQDRCEIRNVEDKGDVTRLSIATGWETVWGESIAVNGVCLTVTVAGPDGFTADVMPETLRLTTLGDLKAGTKVNLERALKLGDALGGHQVQGHVEAVATVSSVTKRETTRDVTFTLPQEIGQNCILKGSIALDGISLTITGCGSDWVSVSLIPETLERTNAIDWQPGTKVNVETDIFVKTLNASLKALLPQYLQNLKKGSGENE